MINVQFPATDFRIRKRGEKQYIFDAIRKKWLLLTEEEWVRQNTVAYLHLTLQVPKEAIALEKKILVNGLSKRFDILVYNGLQQPWMLVECKAPQVMLDDNVLQQVLRYNITVPVKWIVITNGEKTIGWQKEEGNLILVNSLPFWEK